MDEARPPELGFWGSGEVGIEQGRRAGGLYLVRVFFRELFLMCRSLLNWGWERVR